MQTFTHHIITIDVYTSALTRVNSPHQRTASTRSNETRTKPRLTNTGTDASAPTREGPAHTRPRIITSPPAASTHPGLVWFCGPGVLRVVGCYWWCCVLVPKRSPLRLKWVFLAVFGRGGLRFEHIGVLAALRCLTCGPEVTVGSGAASLADRLFACG